MCIRDNLYRWNTDELSARENINGIGNDGEASGWSSSFYNDIMKLPSNVTIGLTGLNSNNSSSTTTVCSCIDSYASWFAVSSPNLEASLFMIAGTSTCYMYGSPVTTTKIPGVWGPFDTILETNGNYSVYTAGQSCTGKLIEHLFKSHPAARKIQRSGEDIYEVLENSIQDIEKKNRKSIHILAKHMFFYGDYEGNRTPFADVYKRQVVVW